MYASLAKVQPAAEAKRELECFCFNQNLNLMCTRSVFMKVFYEEAFLSSVGLKLSPALFVDETSASHLRSASLRRQRDKIQQTGLQLVKYTPKDTALCCEEIQADDCTRGVLCTDKR